MSDENTREYDESRRRFLRHAALAGVGLATGPLLLAGTPADASGLFPAPSVADQKKLGHQAAQQLLQKYHEVTDGRARHFKSIGNRLVNALPHQDKIWDFEFHVLDSKEINAFALPGGPMFLYTGLYEKMTTDDSVAAVTGHEMTHVRKQHWAHAYAAQQQRDTVLGLLLGLSHAGRTAQTLVGVGDSLYGLKYSRGEEQQADDGGLDNMVAAGFNPEGMIQLFQTLEKASGNGGVAFLSDHPLTSERISHARKRIQELARTHHFPPLTPLHYSALF